MKKFCQLIVLIVLLVSFSQVTLANTWLVGPLPTDLQEDRFKTFIEYNHESYLSGVGNGVGFGGYYSPSEYVTVGLMATLGEEAEKVTRDSGEDFISDLIDAIDSVLPNGYTNFTVTVGRSEQVMFLFQHTFEDGGTKVGAFHSVKFGQEKGNFLFGGGIQTYEIVNPFNEKRLSNETTPFLVLEANYNKLYCRFQYVNEIQSLLAHSNEETENGKKGAATITTIGLRFN